MQVTKKTGENLNTCSLVIKINKRGQEHRSEINGRKTRSWKTAGEE